MIVYLRNSVYVQDPTGSTQDPEYISLTDEDLTLIMRVALTKDFPQILSLDNLPNECLYPLMLQTKKELYSTLAMKEAPLFDIGADNNNYLKRSQRFDHYNTLISQVTKEYNDYLENGGAGGNTLTSYDVLLPDRYNTLRNFEKGVTPALFINVDDVTLNEVEISWKVKLSRFKNYKVYISTDKILDEYNVTNPIPESLNEVVTITNVHQLKCRLQGLESNTTYYVVVSATEMSGLTGYIQTMFTTLTPIVVEV